MRQRKILMNGIWADVNVPKSISDKSLREQGFRVRIPCKKNTHKWVTWRGLAMCKRCGDVEDRR